MARTLGPGPGIGNSRAPSGTRGASDRNRRRLRDAATLASEGEARTGGRAPSAWPGAPSASPGPPEEVAEPLLGDLEELRSDGRPGALDAGSAGGHLSFVTDPGLRPHAANPGPIRPPGPPMAPDDRITEEEARRLWARAAELQAEAAQRSELARVHGAEEEVPATGPEEGFELTHVRAAAQEAGIEGEFVDRALADLQAERLAGGDRRAPISRAVLADPPETITASRSVGAPAEAVLRAMERLLPHPPFGLVLQDRHGDPARGGVLVFDIPGATFTPSTQEGLAMDASWADFREVHATVTPLGDEACELTVRAPVAWAWKYNAWMAPFFVGVGGAASFGASLGLAVGATALTGGAAALGGAVIALGTGLGSYGSLLGYRAVYRYSLRKGRTGLEKLVAAVATEAQGGWGLSPADAGPALRSEVDPSSRDGGDEEAGGG